MEDLIEFFLKAGEVKRLKQRGFALRGLEDAARLGGHSFRETLMGWALARSSDSSLDTNRIIKLSLVHDLCAGYAGDITPYEPILWDNNDKNEKQIFEKWVRLSKEEKQRFYDAQRAKEHESLHELTAYLPKNLLTEVESLWTEYEQGLTREGRFVQQVDMLENFLQSLEYWKQDKSFPIEAWWHQIKELISDPFLVEFLKALDKKFYQSE
jgi:putative hydrolases of HD superfamily